MQPGYHSDSEPTWWWQLAKHLYDAQRALANAMAHNVDDPRPAQALFERLREGQAILLEIFRAKGLLPGSPPGSANGRADAGPPAPPGVPAHTAPSQGASVPPAPNNPTNDPAGVSPMINPAGIVEPGQRHAMLKSLAGAMRFRGASYDEIERALLAANQTRCNPPKSDDEVKAIARWASEQPTTNGAYRSHADEPAVSEADQHAIIAAIESAPAEAVAPVAAPEAIESAPAVEAVPGPVSEATELPAATSADPRPGSVGG